MPSSGEISGQLHPNLNSVSCWGSRRDSRATHSEGSVGEDETVAPFVKRSRTETASPSPTDRAASALAVPIADQNELEQVKASLVELQQQMLGFQQHVAASAQQFAVMDHRITQCTTDINQTPTQIQTETSYKFDAIKAMLQQQHKTPPQNPTQ